MGVINHEPRCPNCNSVMDDKGSFDVPRYVCPNCGHDTSKGVIWQ